MTFWQTQLCARGYNEKRRKEIENTAFSIRQLYALVHNMFVDKKDKKDADKLWPLELDKQTKEEVKKKKIYIPLDAFMGIVKGSSDGK